MKGGIRHNTHPGELLKEEILKANNLSITETGFHAWSYACSIVECNK